MSVVTTSPPDTALGPAPLHVPHKRLTRFILPLYTFLMMLYLVSPILLMILYSFNDVPGDRQTPRFWGFTLDWWRNLFDYPSMTQALKNSLTIAPVSAIIATFLGTLLGLALGRYRFRGLGGVDFLIFLAIAIPEIVLGSSLLSMFIIGKAPLGYPTILLAHIGFCIPFVAVTVRARVAGMDRSLEEAAQDLFADPMTAFFKVTLPIILPGIFAGFLLAFVLSLDDFVITNFVSGQTQTFPIWVFGASRIGIPPQVNAMGTILFSVGLLVAIGNIVGRRRRT